MKGRGQLCGDGTQEESGEIVVRQVMIAGQAVRDVVFFPREPLAVEGTRMGSAEGGHRPRHF